MAKIIKRCEGADKGTCGHTCGRKERFCIKCRRIMLGRMRDSNYFVEVPGEPERELEPDPATGLSQAGPWDGDNEP